MHTFRLPSSANVVTDLDTEEANQLALSAMEPVEPHEVDAAFYRVTRDTEVLPIVPAHQPAHQAPKRRTDGTMPMFVVPAEAKARR